MYKGLKKAADGKTFSGECPVCDATVQATLQKHVLKGCSHLVRVWIVTADGRMRAEFREELVHA